MYLFLIAIPWSYFNFITILKHTYHHPMPGILFQKLYLYLMFSHYFISESRRFILPYSKTQRDNLNYATETLT
jgi:hypothetical protein